MDAALALQPAWPRRLPGNVWRAVRAWLAEGCASKAAGVAFYTILSLAPFLVLALAGASMLVDAGVALEHLRTQLAGLVGADGADFLMRVVARANAIDAAGPAALVAGATTLFAATAAIVELQSALDALSKESPPKSSLSALVRVRLLGIGAALALGFLIVVSLILSAVAAALVAWSGLSSNAARWLLLLTNEAVSTALVAIVFYALLRFLPRMPLPRRPATIGAVAAAALFELAKFAIGWYVADAGSIKVYGAAGSIVVVMLWVYYVSGIFLLGALIARECAGGIPTRGYAGHDAPAAGKVSPTRG